mmetsp:Transcript_9733/g.16192  ORF Transcript_9733/g.16192 Transcript_9733/m.16192 type:complete len:130 (+) Transcript_9733:1-390(+)
MLARLMYALYKLEQTTACLGIISSRSYKSGGRSVPEVHTCSEIRLTVISRRSLGCDYARDTDCNDNHGNQGNLQKDSPSDMLSSLVVLVLMTSTKVERNETYSAILVRVAPMLVLESKETPHGSPHQLH